MKRNRRKRSSKTFWLVSLLLLLSLWRPVWSQSSLDALLDGVRQRYEGRPGLVITYTREVVTRSMMLLGGSVKGDLATGTIHSRPPHDLRLEQKTPRPETLVTDGKTLWWVVPAEKRAYRYPARKFGQELRLLSDVFSGLSAVRQSFRLTLEGKDEEGRDRLKMTPDPPWEQIDEIVLTVTAECEIRTVDIRNPLGNTTRFHIHEVQTKERFEEGFFEFTPSAGMEVVEEGR